MVFVTFFLSKADQLMFAMHFVKGMHPELFLENVSSVSLFYVS